MSLLCSGPLVQRKGPAAFATGPLVFPIIAAFKTRPRYVTSRTVHSAPRTQHCVLVHPAHAATAAARGGFTLRFGNVSHHRFGGQQQ